ncbi:MAG: hypothetical protein P8Y44_03290 [Acidobacteriota bacterium]
MGCYLMVALMASVPAVAEASDAESADQRAEANSSRVLEWPRRFELDSGGSLTIGQPQFERWEGFKALRGTAVVTYVRAKTNRDPYLGTIIFDASSEIDLQADLVRVYGITLLEGAYSGLSVKDSKMLTSLLTTLFPSQLVMSLDQVLAGVRRGIEEVPGVQQDVEVPEIVVRRGPATLVRFEGEPRFSPVKDSTVERAENTDRVLYRWPKKKTYFLLDEGVWLGAPSLDGPWTMQDKLPKPLRNLDLDEEGWSLPADVRSSESSVEIVPPQVVVTTGAALLVEIDGEPHLEPIEGVELAWVANTNRDLFVFNGDRSYFLWTGNLWLRAESLDGPWSVVTESLPGEFSRIPPDHPKGDLLVHVPGTAEAREASARAAIPGNSNIDTDRPGFALGDFTVDGENNLYAGQDGQVYRHDEQGWQSYSDGDWIPLAPPEPAKKDQSDGRQIWGPDSLNQAVRRRVYNLLQWDYQSRIRGEARARQRFSDSASTVE